MQVVHGVLVRVAGTGVLIIGEAGSGKSALALALIAAGHQLVADDVIELTRENGCFTGSPPSGYAGLLEVRGIGVLDVRKLYEPDSFVASSSVDICIELIRDGSGNGNDEFEALEAAIPRFALMVTDIVDRRLFLETAVRVFRDPNIKRDLAHLSPQ